MGMEKGQKLEGVLKPSILKKLEVDFIEKNKMGIIKILEEAWKDAITKNRVSSSEGCVLIIPKEKLKVFAKQFIVEFFAERGWVSVINFNLDNNNTNIYIKLTASDELGSSPLEELETVF